MTEIHIADEATGEYGPDLVDRWKARAFQQDAESETPCCGYEEEDTNWGGSSTLLGSSAAPSARCARPGAPTRAPTWCAARPSTARR
jgi:hypothetical protein